MIDGAKHHHFAGFVTASHAAQGDRMRMRQKAFSIKNETQKKYNPLFSKENQAAPHIGGRLPEKVRGPAYSAVKNVARPRKIPGTLAITIGQSRCFLNRP